MQGRVIQDITTKVKFEMKLVDKLQLQSDVLIVLIFLLTISSDWDSVISTGRVCRYFRSINLTVSMLYVSPLATNTYAIKIGFEL